MSGTARTSALIQGELWSAEAHAWSQRSEGLLLPLYTAALERLGPKAGESLLDAGCGSGLFAALAAWRGAAVTGLDAARALIELARKRCDAARFVVGDLEELDFADGSFDFCVALNSVMYASDPRRALAELARVTRTDGQVLVTVGSGIEQAACAAKVDALAPDAAVPSWDGFDLRRGPALDQALRAAGFKDVHVDEIAFDVTFATLEEAVLAQRPTGPVQAAARRSGWQTVNGELRTFFAARTRPDGSVVERLVFGCGTGTRLPSRT